MLRTLASQSSGDIANDKLLESETLSGKTTQPLSIEGFSVRDWFRQMEPDQVKNLDVSLIRILF